MRRHSSWIPAVKRKLLGNGLLDRVRNASIALFGATTAVGLFLVAVSVNQELPTLRGLPIPDAPFEHGAGLVAPTATTPTPRGGGTVVTGFSLVPVFPVADEAARARDSKPPSGPPIVQQAEVRVSIPVEAGSGEPPEEPTPVTEPTSPSPAPIAAAPPPTTSPPESSGEKTSGPGSGRFTSGSDPSRGVPHSSDEVTTEEPTSSPPPPPPPPPSPAIGEDDENQGEEPAAGPPSSERGPPPWAHAHGGGPVAGHGRP